LGPLHRTVRLAYISYEYPPDSANGGIATYVAQAARMMQRRGWAVEVFAASPVRSEVVEQDGIRTHWLPETDRLAFADAAGKAFAARHREARFDVLEGPEYHADACVAKKLVPDVPLVVKMHTPSALIRELNSPPYPSAATLAYRAIRHLAASAVKGRRPRFDRLFADTRAAAKRLDRCEAQHAQAASIVAPPCRDLCEYATSRWGIDPKRVRLSPHPYEPSRELLALEPRGDGLVVGYVGRLERRKGIEVVARAIPAVCRQIPNVTFRFVGAAEYHAESGIRYDEWVRRECRDYASRLQFVGKVPLAEMARAYGDLDMCVFPSLWENFPNVCLEAMAAGRAVIGSSGGGMREMLDEGRAGITVKPGDAAALAVAIIDLANAPTERERLGRLARARVLQAYNSDVIGAMMEGIYKEAIGDAGSNRRHLHA